MPIALGIDAANVLRDRRGIGRYVRSMVRLWDASFGDRAQATLLLPGLFPAMAQRALAEAIGVDAVRVARRSDAARGSFDLVWFPWNGMTWTTAARSVVTIHDLWPFVSPAADPRVRAREQGHYRAGAARADRFIAVSRFTAREAARYLDIDPERIDVVPHGVEGFATNGAPPASIAGAERYVLFVGEMEARKDVATLLDAASRLPQRLRETTTIVLVGKGERAMNELPSGVRVEMAGEVSDERLATLYAGAAALAFPSAYEGFGLPVLEAMHYGAPVIAADAGGLRDAGGEAALYFPAGDAAALAAALTRVLDDQGVANGLRSAGLARAATMTSMRCAAETLAVFERVVAG